MKPKLRDLREKHEQIFGLHVHKKISILISLQHKFAINNICLVFKRCFYPSPENEHVDNLERLSFKCHIMPMPHHIYI